MLTWLRPCSSTSLRSTRSDGSAACASASLLAAWRCAGAVVSDLARRLVVNAAAAGRRRLSVEERVMLLVMLAVDVRRFVGIILNDNYSHLQGREINRSGASIGGGMCAAREPGRRAAALVQLIGRVARADELT